ncbi:peptidase S8/S53 subtilisin kexin sedolisin [Streptomyces montanus]|uniref:Peptidase S8/S53 subtilisin kexin sedolisin n=1 Tax=Streptomyces montanus TaxID=2580423 RepID=A0A5R9FTY7_9ACTN|nr:S8 family serine peptidase [Streptomyces montanus]TLS43005.1 peptidase S8/S53 subtilisin kexin sedolisin [Streptomyces montanus]
MRRLHALWAVAGAAGLLAGAITPAAAGPGSPATGPDATLVQTGDKNPRSAVKTGGAGTQTVTLITGDTVSLTAGPDGKSAVDVRRGKGREAATFLSSERDGEISVLPADAVPLLRAGRLDPALFNITQLVKQGYTDAKTGSTPLIATYTKGSATPDGARRTLALPGIDGAALSARKSTAFWADIAPALGTEPTTKAARQLGEGIEKVWLDAKVKVSLDASVPQIGAPEVWESGYDGKGVEVAVLDTGVDTGHPDLAGRIAGTKSFVPEQTVRDGHGHGTHVASTIVGSGAASEGKRKGVAPGAELLVGKVLADDGRGQTSWILEGMQWAAHSGAKVVSMSLGGAASGPSDVLSETVDELSASTGALFVIAAGNTGPSEKTIGTPGIADSALTVGAVDKSDQLASFSSRGPRLGDSAVKPEITAPGVGITAARASGTSMGTPVDANYTSANGTSMATPHVAGAAALVAQAHPDWTGQQIKQALATTAKTNTVNSVFEQGDGRVDAVRAVRQGVFATPALSFGTYEDDDTEVATKDITYTNTTDKAVELKVSSTLAEVAPGAGTVTVPAKGTATVPVSVDPSKQAQGRYAGHITASADGVLVTTGVGFEKAPKTYDLKVSLVGRDGKASTAAALYTLQELNGAYPDEYGFIGDTWTWQVPAGTYSMATWIPDRDAGGVAVGTSVVGNPEIKVDKDTEVVLDARKAVEIKPKTKQDSEFQGFSTNWHREGPGSKWGLTYSQGFWTDHIYVAPTQKVTEGTLEFSAKFRLYAKEVTASVTSPEKSALSSLYYAQTYNGFPLKITGDRTVQAVDAGGGTAADFEGLDVKGKVAVVGLGATEVADEALANATKAGAGYVIAYRKKPGFWIAAVDRATTTPLMIATGEEGARLTDLLKTGKKVRLKLGGTPVSPYVYNLLVAQSGSIAQNQTYRMDSSNTAKRKARYYGAKAGEMGADALYTFRPWQLFGIENSKYMQLGTERTEYYYVDPDTRTWDTVYPNWEASRGQWSPLRTYSKATTEPTENWLRQVVRPGTSEEYGLSERTGDKLTLQVAELSDATPGHYGYIDGTQDTAKGKLYADGQLVGDSVRGGYGTFDVSPDKASYRFELDVQRRAPWAAYSTSTHSEWSFASAHTDTKTALPLLTVGIAPKGLDLLNRAESRRDSVVDLTVGNQLGSVRASSLKAWVSYDDGTSWKEVKVKHDEARFRPAKGAESVSLRVRATDRDGNSVDQTVLRAFGLK